MIDTKNLIEKFLQNRRFDKVKPYIKGDVLDFGGNEGELKKFVKGNYILVNYDHSPMDGAHADTIVALAVVEHIHVEDVFKIFSRFKTILNPGGHIFLTTPTKIAKPVLEFMAFIGLTNKENIEEHKHYWNKKELFDLAEKSGFSVEKYKKFQLGFNQYAVLRHK